MYIGVFIQFSRFYSVFESNWRANVSKIIIKRWKNIKQEKGLFTFTFGEFPKLLGGEHPSGGDGVIAHHPVVRIVRQPLEVQGVVILPLGLADVTW